MKSAHLPIFAIKAHFVAFNLKPEQGRAIIKKALTYGWMIIRWRRLKWN
jgi:hypothetical protein